MMVSVGLGEALLNMEATICMNSRDWSLDPMDAAIYAVVVGWGEALDEVAQKHGWTPAQVAKLKQYRVEVSMVQMDADETFGWVDEEANECTS